MDGTKVYLGTMEICRDESCKVALESNIKVRFYNIFCGHCYNNQSMESEDSDVSIGIYLDISDV